VLTSGRRLHHRPAGQGRPDQSRLRRCPYRHARDGQGDDGNRRGLPATRIREEVHADANIIVGATFEESLDGVIRVSVVATGVDTSSAKCPPGGVPHRAGVAAGPCRIVSGRLAQCPSAGAQNTQNGAQKN